MKKISVFSLLIGGSLLLAQTVTLSNAAIVLSDQFSGPSLDSSKWNLLLPFNNTVLYDWTSHNVTSTAGQASGELTLRAGASISSLQSFASPYVFSGTFNQTSPGGRTIITLRGDGTSFEPSYGAPNGNIFLFFFGDPNNSPNWKVQILQSSLAQPYNYPELPASYRDNTFPLSMDSPTSFSIRDYGDRLVVYINNVLVSDSAVSTTDFGGHVSIGSQWIDSSGLKVDMLMVESIPEPSTYAAGLLLTLGAAFRRFLPRRKS
jgi:hypothetical protein